MVAQDKEFMLLISTNHGNIKVRLYNDTPLHRDQYLKLAEEGFFRDKIFHRVIKGFMIQGGEAEFADSLVTEPDNIPSEIKFPEYYHKKGVIAAARMGNDVNPEKASSGCQFYIVVGDTVSEEKLVAFEKQRFERMKQDIFKRLQTENKETIKAYYKEGNRSALADLRSVMQQEADDEAESRRNEILYTETQKEVYKTIGGTPHLDGEYTVFGEVVEGLDVVDKIQNVPTGRADKPIENVVFSIRRIEE